MAEIRSTLDMVMERADRLCAEAAPQDGPDHEQQGMRAGAELLRGMTEEVERRLAALPAAARPSWIKGVLATLLRNIALPRDDGSPWRPALDALRRLEESLGGGAGLEQILAEIDNILGQYNQHRRQILTQLEEAFQAQAAQMRQDIGPRGGMDMGLSPANHPKFQEELQRHYDQLNEQYLGALQQYKRAIGDRLLALA